LKCASRTQPDQKPLADECGPAFGTARPTATPFHAAPLFPFGGSQRPLFVSFEVVQKLIERFASAVMSCPIRTIVRPGNLDAHCLLPARNRPAKWVFALATATHKIRSTSVVGMHTKHSPPTPRQSAPNRRSLRSLGSHRLRFRLASGAARFSRPPLRFFSSNYFIAS